jgi:hypothetical protein
MPLTSTGKIQDHVLREPSRAWPAAAADPRNVARSDGCNGSFGEARQRAVCAKVAETLVSPTGSSPGSGSVHLAAGGIGVRIRQRTRVS